VNDARRWVTYATVAWTLVFGAPHLWWALGIRFWFPGGDDSYEFFMSSEWRYVFNLVVVVLSVLAGVVALALLKPPSLVVRRWIPLTLAWVGAGMLTIRGVAGLIVDGIGRPYWTHLFTVGGVLLGAVAALGRAPLGVDA
jgi:hypothetical protein